MGTYLASKFRRARTPKQCHCGTVIAEGDEYLDYKPGLRVSIPVCLTCAPKRTEHGLRFRCLAVEERFTGTREARV